MTFAEKVKKERIILGYSQTVLSELVGVSLRTITAYEKGEKKPRPATLFKLAEVLKVSTTYLNDPLCDDPYKDINRDAYIAEARNKYGASGANDVNGLLAANRAMFAGGELSDDQKEQFFQAITEAYFACREEAKRRASEKKK